MIIDSINNCTNIDDHSPIIIDSIKNNIDDN